MPGDEGTDVNKSDQGSQSTVYESIRGTIVEAGINPESPARKEITASLLQKATILAGVTRSHSWVRSCMTKDLVDAARWVGLNVDEAGRLSIPDHWRRPDDATLERFRLPRLAHWLADRCAYGIAGTRRHRYR